MEMERLKDKAVIGQWIVAGLVRGGFKSISGEFFVRVEEQGDLFCFFIWGSEEQMNVVRKRRKKIAGIQTKMASITVHLEADAETGRLTECR